MRFRILGPVEINDGGTWRGIGATKCRALLAALLVRPNEVVPTDQLIFELWADHPPKSASTQVHGYVMRLRRTIRTLATVAPGYRLEVAPEDVDATRFTALATRARTLLTTDPAQAARTLTEAMALWRGEPLADVPTTDRVATESIRLTEHRLVATEDLFEAELAAGHHRTIIGELTAHVAANPLREQSWHQLMRSLYRSDRQAEALRTYQRLRRTLLDEVGVEPNESVKDLYREILTRA